MFGIGGAIVLGEKWRVLDPVAAVIVSLFILKVSIEILSGCVRELVESSLDEGIEAEILRLALDVQGVADPHNLRTRSIGKDIAVDLHVRVDGGMSVNEAHDITVAIEDRIRGRFGKSSFVSIHIEPVKIGG